jgi:hypothetical protein
LEIAEEIDVRTHVVLPFDPARFRRSSVDDRPGDWGWRFDRAIDRAAKANTLVVMDLSVDDDLAYSVATHRLVSLASEISGGRDVVAISVAESDAQPRSAPDATAEFRRLSLERGFRLVDIEIT